MSTSRDSEPLVQPIEASDSGATVTAADEPVEAPPVRRGRRGRRQASENMLPQRDRRSLPERLLVRLVATCGIVGIGVVISAIMVSSNDQGWIVGLVVSIVSVVLAAVLWSSRVL
jgi:hypothetical protein